MVCFSIDEICDQPTCKWLSPPQARHGWEIDGGVAVCLAYWAGNMSKYVSLRTIIGATLSCNLLPKHFPAAVVGSSRRRSGHTAFRIDVAFLYTLYD